MCVDARPLKKKIIEKASNNGSETHRLAARLHDLMQFLAVGGVFFPFAHFASLPLDDGCIAATMQSTYTCSNDMGWDQVFSLSLFPFEEERTPTGSEQVERGQKHAARLS